MPSILTRAKFALAALAVAAIPAGAAFAEGNGPTYGGMVTSAPAMPDVGQGFRPNPAYTVHVTIGGTLPPISNGEGEPQPINSVPPGFEDGTPAMQHRQAMQRYWAEQAGQAEHLADPNQQPDG
jgi:hypothetical protein